MTTASSHELSGVDLQAFGTARVAEAAYEAVHRLWARRRAGGLSQKELAKRLGRDPGWVARNLRGPANWTFRTFGEFVQALDGEAEIKVFGLEEAVLDKPNYDAYEGYRPSSATSTFLPMGGSNLVALESGTVRLRAADLAGGGSITAQPMAAFNNTKLVWKS